jgi:alpha-1,2-mannosyltransferase
MARLQAQLPEGMKLIPYYDRTQLVAHTVHTVTENLALGAVLVVGILGFRLAARLDRLGERVAVVATVGMLAVLLSPVSWIHHLHWGIVVVGALLGDGRERRRVLAALGVAAVLLLRVPWWGQWMQRRHGWEHYLGRLEQNSYCLLALLSLLALWWLVARPASRRTPDSRSTAPTAATAATAAGSADGEVVGPAVAGGVHAALGTRSIDATERPRDVRRV